MRKKASQGFVFPPSPRPSSTFPSLPCLSFPSFHFLNHGALVGVVEKYPQDTRGCSSGTSLDHPSILELSWADSGPCSGPLFFCYHGLLCPFVRRSVRPPSPHPPPSLAFPCPIRRQALAPMGRPGRLELPWGGTMTLAVCVAAAWLALAGFARAGATTTTVPEELCIYDCFFPFLLLFPSTSRLLLFFGAWRFCSLKDKVGGPALSPLSSLPEGSLILMPHEPHAPTPIMTARLLSHPHSPHPCPPARRFIWAIQLQ